MGSKRDDVRPRSWRPDRPKSVGRLTPPCHKATVQPSVASANLAGAVAPLDLAAARAMPRGPRDHLSTTSYSKATPFGSFSLNHSSARSGLANTLISTRQGWLISIPGDPEMRSRRFPIRDCRRAGWAISSSGPARRRLSVPVGCGVLACLDPQWPNLNFALTNYLCALLYTGRNDYPSPA
jgi:hypothetical protein